MRFRLVAACSRSPSRVLPASGRRRQHELTRSSFAIAAPGAAIARLRSHSIVVVVAVHHVAAAREPGDDNQRNPGAVAEEIKRLKEPRIPVTAALVEGNEE